MGCPWILPDLLSGICPTKQSMHLSQNQISPILGIFSPKRKAPGIQSYATNLRGASTFSLSQKQNLNHSYFQDFIKTPSGRTHLAWVHVTKTVQNLKYSVFQHTGYPTGSQGLILGGRVLQDHKPLMVYKILPEFTITLTLNLRLRGGAKHHRKTNPAGSGIGCSTAKTPKTHLQKKWHRMQHSKNSKNSFKMMKLFIFALLVAVAIAAPQFYQQGWTDGPNNGVGPYGLAYAAYPHAYAHYPYTGGLHYI